MQALAPTRRALLAGLGASAMMSVSPARASQSATPPGWERVDLLDADDRSFRLARFSQPFTLVTLWANWCSVCLRELGTLAQILPAVGADKMQHVLISHPSDWVRNQDITRGRRLPLLTARPSASNPSSLLHEALLSANGTFYVPRNILFSRDRGEVVWSHTGGLENSAALDQLRRFVRQV